MTDFLSALPAYMTEAAARFGTALEKLDWPSSKSGPCPEDNVLLNLHTVLSRLEPPFHFYGEAPMSAYVRADGNSGQAGTVRLIGSNGEIALAI